MHFYTQVNTSIAKLDLEYNKFGPGAGKALAKSLEVVFTFSVDSQLDFPFWCVLW